MAAHGDRNNLPERLSNYANKESIIYWSLPRDDQPIVQAQLGEVAVMICFLPFFTPIICCCACYEKSRQLGIIAVLTTKALEFIERDGTVHRMFLENLHSVKATTKSPYPSTPTGCTPDVNRLVINDVTREELTILWGHDNIEEFSRLILDAKERLLQPSMMQRTGQHQQQPMMMMMQPVMQQQPIMMQQQPIMMQPMMIQSPSPGQPYPSIQQQQMTYVQPIQQQQMAYGQSMMQQPVAYGQPMAYGQPVIQQPYASTPSFTYGTIIYPQPMNSSPGEYEYPKR